MNTNMYKKTLGYRAAVLTLGFMAMFMAACSSDTSNNDVVGGSTEDGGIYAVKDWKVVGVSQKGPFITGSVVTVQELDSVTLNQTGKSFRGAITSDKGDFSIVGINLASQYAMLEANGYYRNEVTGEKSTGTVTLRAITDLSDRNTVNINLFTHLEYERVMHLVLEEGKTVAAAKAQAESEILAAFGISVQLTNPEDLNIFESGDGNAALLAVSILMQGGVEVAGLTERMGNFSMSLAAEGKWDDAKTRAAVADWAVDADFSGELTDILQNLSEWSGGEVPDFIGHVRNFWEGSFGLGECTDSREGEVVADSNKQSAYYYENSGARFVCESGNWIKASNIKADTDGFDAGEEGEMRAGRVDSLNKYVYDGGKWREATHLELNLGVGCVAAMPAVIAEGFVCKGGNWVVAKNYDYDIAGTECVEDKAIVGAKTSIEYVCKGGKFVAATSMQTWFGANGSDSIYNVYSEAPSLWFARSDSEIDGGNSVVDWHVPAAAGSPSAWMQSVIDTCKGICADVTFGDAFVSPYVDFGFSFIQNMDEEMWDKGVDVTPLEGLCVAYSSSIDAIVSMVVPQSVSSDFAYPQYVLPASDTVRVERIPWSSFEAPSWTQEGVPYGVAVKKTTGILLRISGDAGTSASFNVKAIGPYNGDCDKYAELE